MKHISYQAIIIKHLRDSPHPLNGDEISKILNIKSGLVFCYMRHPVNRGLVVKTKYNGRTAYKIADNEWAKRKIPMMMKENFGDAD